MRWLIDECVDADLAALLRRSGHDVVYMAEVDRFGNTLFGRYTIIEEARFRSRPLRPA